MLKFINQSSNSNANLNEPIYRHFFFEHLIKEHNRAQTILKPSTFFYNLKATDFIFTLIQRPINILLI